MTLDYIYIQYCLICNFDKVAMCSVLCADFVRAEVYVQILFVQRVVCRFSLCRGSCADLCVCTLSRLLTLLSGFIVFDIFDVFHIFVYIHLKHVDMCLTCIICV